MQSINWILDNDISEAGLDLNFSTEHQSFGKTEHVELLPGGADIPVTDENKHGYVKAFSPVVPSVSGCVGYATFDAEYGSCETYTSTALLLLTLNSWLTVRN
jgi:hypothetical protein